MFRRSNGKLYVEYEAYGKTVQKSTRLEDTPKNRTLVKKEVIPALQLKIISGEFDNEKPKTFSYYSEIYLEEKKHLKSYDRIQKHVNELNKFFGEIRIDHLKRSHVKEWVRKLLQSYTPKTVKNYLSSIHGVIGVALDHEVINVNVARNIKFPKHYPKEVEPFTREEVVKLLDNANEFFKLYLAIGFYTGMRRGEILGLMYNDIDFENRTISVKRSVTEGKVSTPKTEKSIRLVPILDDLLPYLKKPEKSLWLFSKSDGSHLKYFNRNRKRQWRRMLEEQDIAYRKLYTTRHTFIVSMLKYSDLSVLEVAQIVGHTTTQMIIQNYGKFIKGEHLKIDRSLNLFTDNSTDSKAKNV